MSADTLTERIREIKEREAKATKGPWELVPADDYYIRAKDYPAKDVSKYTRDNTDKTLAMIGNQTADCGESNAEFITHARADIPYLLEQLEKALSELSAAEQAGRKEEREQCCKVICHRCDGRAGFGLSSDGNEVVEEAKLQQWANNRYVDDSSEVKWRHIVHSGNLWETFDCLAAAIRNRE